MLCRFSPLASGVVFCLFLQYDSFVRFALVPFTSLKDVIMADKKVELTNLESQWIRKALELQRTSLQRSVAKEIVGSDIYVLRRREISDLDALINKF